MWGTDGAGFAHRMSFAEYCVSVGPQDPEGQRAGRNAQTDWVHENEPVETPAPRLRRA